MNSELYDIKKIDGDNQGDWDALIETSPQYTPFMRDDYLEVIGYDAIKYIVYRKKRPFCGICIPVSRETGESVGAVPYSQYQGLVYQSSDDNYMDYHNNLEATDLLLDYLYENSGMKKIAFSNSYTVRDIRAVQWHHYHEPEKGMYDINVWYTSIKKLDTENLENISKRRKRDYKQSQGKYHIVCERSANVSDFIDLYEKTFFRQGIELTEWELCTVHKITKLSLEKGFGELWYALDENGRRIDATLFVYGNQTGYYLFGANDPETRSYGGATMLFIEQMKQMVKNGITSFDFIGVNSPQRGDFKLSFGGKIVPYYECSIAYCS